MKSCNSLEKWEQLDVIKLAKINLIHKTNTSVPMALYKYIIATWVGLY